MLRSATQGIAWIMGLTLLLAYTPAWAGPALVFPEDRWHVALDAGHGGDDTGGRGPTGLLEKAVSLELARTLALRLEDLHRVTLTRSDDYHVQLRQRAAIANQARANLYLSLHTGASFLHAARGTVIYYHAPSKKPSDRPADNRAGAAAAQPWRQVQARHFSSSHALANAMKAGLETHPEFSDIRVVGAPLAPLEGVDMPAILIELGHITNPAMEQRMASTQGVASMVQAIATGIDDYIRSQAADPRQ